MNDQELIAHVRAELEAGNERLDGATRSRLTQARHRALASRRHHHRPLWVWPASGALLATLVAVTVWLGREPTVNEAFSASDFEMLTEGEGVELYQEMEFLQWLEEESNGVV